MPYCDNIETNRDLLDVTPRSQADRLKRQRNGLACAVVALAVTLLAMLFWIATETPRH